MADGDGAALDEQARREGSRPTSLHGIRGACIFEAERKQCRRSADENINRSQPVSDKEKADNAACGGSPGMDCCASLEPWECFQPANKDQSARPWLGMVVTSRPDGGGWPLEKGIVTEGMGSLDDGWFEMVNERHPNGMLTHTQEVYPPEFSGCDLPCCRHNDERTHGAQKKGL